MKLAHRWWASKDAGVCRSAAAASSIVWIFRRIFSVMMIFSQRICTQALRLQSVHRRASQKRIDRLSTDRVPANQGLTSAAAR